MAAKATPSVVSGATPKLLQINVVMLLTAKATTMISKGRKKLYFCKKAPPFDGMLLVYRFIPDGERDACDSSMEIPQ
jgi:hypothetical protein